MGEWLLTTNGYVVSLRGDGNTLQLGSHGCWKILLMYKKHLTKFKWVILIVCEVYPSKYVKKIIIISQWGTTLIREAKIKG